MKQLPEEKVIETHSSGMMALYAGVAEHLGIPPGDFIGPGGVNEVNPEDYTAGLRGMKMLDLEHGYSTECVVHHMTEEDGGSGKVFCTVFLTRPKGQFKVAVTVQKAPWYKDAKREG